MSAIYGVWVYRPERLPSIFGISWSAKIVAVLGMLTIFQMTVQAIRAMFRDPKASFLIVTSAFAGPGTAVDLAWYPPNATNINNLTQVIATTGVYGFVYNSSYPQGVPYGSYNWCNMPHVRREEYVRPPDEYELRYVEVIHRHHKRTVYAANSFPIESYEWDCDDESLFYYGQTANGKEAAQTFWKGYLSPANPFKPRGFIGSCQFPQITTEGLEDSWQHGRDLYGVYHDLLNFLPDQMDDTITFRVTQNTITSQVAGMVINGMFNTQNAIPLLVAPRGFDSLEPTYPCVTAETLFKQQQDSEAWTDHLKAVSSLYATLDNISGVPHDDSGFHSSLDHYYDNLSARQCHSKPLPCKIIDNSECITQPLANTVYRLGHWEYSRLYRDSPSSLAIATGQFGTWVGELARNIRDTLEGVSSVKYGHNVAHDGSIARLLAFLQVDVMVWPGMGAEIVFEVWEKTGKGTGTGGTSKGKTTRRATQNFYIRILFSGTVLRSSNPSLGSLDMVPLQLVLAYFDGLVGVDASKLVGKCEGSEPF